MYIPLWTAAQHSLSPDKNEHRDGEHLVARLGNEIILSVLMLVCGGRMDGCPRDSPASSMNSSLHGQPIFDPQEQNLNFRDMQSGHSSGRVANPAATSSKAG